MKTLESCHSNPCRVDIAESTLRRLIFNFLDYFARFVSVTMSQTSRAMTATPPIQPIIHIGHIIPPIPPMPPIIPRPIVRKRTSKTATIATTTNNAVLLMPQYPPHNGCSMLRLPRIDFQTLGAEQKATLCNNMFARTDAAVNRHKPIRLRPYSYLSLHEDTWLRRSDENNLLCTDTLYCCARHNSYSLLARHSWSRAAETYINKHSYLEHLAWI